MCPHHLTGSLQFVERVGRRKLAREYSEAGRVDGRYRDPEKWDATINLVELHHERFGFRRGIVPEQMREFFDCRRPEYRGYRYFPTCKILNSCDQPGCQQGMAADFKKIVVDP